MADDRDRTGRTLHADVCVVGAGIVGLAHALEARRRGLRVALLERDERALGASVRNFGHAFCASVADGDDLECALRARERWLELGARGGLHVVAAGTLVVARHEDELAVLEAVARNERRGARIVTAAQAGRLAPIPTDGLAGAMYAAGDLRVDPRGAVAGLARLLQEDPEADVEFGTPVHALEPGVVYGRRVTVHAPLIVVCPGPDYGSLPDGCRPALDRVTLCKLQMLSVAAPDRRRYDPALVTGLSLVRYPAFTAQPGAAAVRARLQAERPELLEAGIHLLVTQRPTGELVIGDTHTYGDAPSPFREERLDELLLAEARRLLGAPALAVRERWLGIYPARADRGAPGEAHFVVSEPFKGARIVEVTSGLGMTMSFGHAGRVLDALQGARELEPTG